MAARRAHLAQLGCLGPELTIGHGNWVSESDLDLIADCGCTICHNASSGLRLGSGIAPVNAMRKRGIPVALGIDQSNIADDRDMLLEMKLVWALHRGQVYSTTGQMLPLFFRWRPNMAQKVLATAEAWGGWSRAKGPISCF